MLLFILGIIDILAGGSMLIPNFLGFYIGIAMLLKGLSSMLGLATGDAVIIIMGVIDIVAGIMLLTGFFVPWFWLILVVKGLYSMAVGFG
jgi:hypothetical protein